MSIISIGIPIPERSALPGQTGSGEEVNLQYATQNYCAGTGQFSPTVATPAGGTFSPTSSPGFSVNGNSGLFNLGVSQPGSYVVTYTVPGVGSANFPINIGATIDTTITGDSSTCIGFAPSPADLTAVSGYSNYEWFKDNTSVQNGTSNTYTPAFNVAGNFVYKVTITDSSLGIPCTATSSDFAFAVNALPTISIADATGGFCSGSSTTITTTVSAGTVFAWYKDDVLIVGQTGSTLTVTEAGEYTATVTDGNGCTSLPSTGLEIEQFDSPTVTIATVPGTTICTGDTATLTANPTGGTGPYIYSWSTGGTGSSISVAPTTTTTYTVTVTDDNGCTGAASQEITASTAGTAIASINNDAAMSFNGTDQYIEAAGVTSLNGLSTMSFSLWVKAASGAQADNYSTILTIADSTTSQGQIIFSQADTANNFNFYVRTSSGYGTPATTGTGFFNGNWRHVAGTYDGANLKLYLDGTQVNSVSRTGNLITATGELYLSRSYNTLQNFFNGELDEVAIWDSALSSCDIKGIYEGSIGSNAGKAANLLDTNTTIPAPVYWNRMGDS